MSDEITLRDTFAAAALTGLIERRPWPVDKNESATICYQFADAMLRERAATNHDAAPAAKAAELARSPGQSPRGTGDTTWEPLCWCCSGPGIQSFHESKADAEEYREHSGIADEVEVFQVGRAFALTDAEREAIQTAIDILTDPVCRAENKKTATLRALLARHTDQSAAPSTQL